MQPVCTNMEIGGIAGLEAILPFIFSNNLAKAGIAGQYRFMTHRFNDSDLRAY